MFAGNLMINFTLPASHRIQQLFSLIATGSRKFKPCFDHSRLLVLPPQSPVDSWILRDRIAQLNLFLPIQVSRVELSSFTLNVHPPTHNLSVSLSTFRGTFRPLRPSSTTCARDQLKTVIFFNEMNVCRRLSCKPQCKTRKSEARGSKPHDSHLLWHFRSSHNNDAHS
ncbi:unnamed protein product [Dibothriocephalus latus]|uniref:Uncharacterized protein n=1 Tax=Dibothriocephalus latus TaxID=60516 RepID=A0A3P7MDP7_DIBLA|nr:unnamed protein product [Dibothriocephalus latus]